MTRVGIPSQPHKTKNNKSKTTIWRHIRFYLIQKKKLYTIQTHYINYCFRVQWFKKSTKTTTIVLAKFFYVSYANLNLWRKTKHTKRSCIIHLTTTTPKWDYLTWIRSSVCSVWLACATFIKATSTSCDQSCVFLKRSVRETKLHETVPGGAKWFPSK